LLRRLISTFRSHAKPHSRDWGSIHDHGESCQGETVHEDRRERHNCGTPALDLTHQIVGLKALILVDSVASDDAAGTLALYSKEDILRDTPAERLDPHSSAPAECLMTAEVLGAMPPSVLLVGIAGKCYEPGHPLSAAVRHSVGAAIDAILEELQRLGFKYQKKVSPEEPGIWWSDHQYSTPVETLR
jgi:hydrogenase maturation protease